jgi:hypothetical protein
MFFSPEAIRRAVNKKSSSTDLASAASFNQRPSPPAISHLSSSADLLSACSSINQRPSPPPASILVNNLPVEEQKQPASYVFLPIAEVTSNVTSGKSTPLSGRDTPTISDWQQAELKPVVKGRERGAVSYSVPEHVALLQLMLTQPNSFNVSESSEEWRELHKQMCNSYYLPTGNNPRPSVTLHGHLVEMYGAFKKAVRSLSLQPGAPKCPTSYNVTEEEQIKEYVDCLYNVVISCKKKYMPKTWWSVDVLSLLLALHLQYAAQYSGGEQTLPWLEGKAVETKTKFERDQKNRELEIKMKRQKEEEENEEAAKNRKVVAESSIKLTETLAAFVSNRGSDNTSIDDKLNTFKTDLLQQLDAREQAAEARIASKLDEKFGDLLRVLRGG